MERVCSACGTVLARPLRCSRCRARWYCSTVCQRADWPAHKSECVRVPPTASSPAAISSVTGGSPAEVAGLPRVSGGGRVSGGRRTSALEPAKFPHRMRVFSFVPSPDGLHENLLVLLHGLGDTQKSYETLAKTMALPQTCCVALRAPLDLPFGLGYGWYTAFNQQDGSLIVPTAQEKRRLDALAKAEQLLTEFIAVLEQQYAWDARRIFFLGFSQGAVVAVRVALGLGDKRLGGVVAVSDSLLEEEVLAFPAVSRMRQAPMLITHGRRDSMVGIGDARRHLAHLRAYYQNKELVQWREYDKGHEMIKSKEEMQDVMAFFSDHLVLRSVALEQRDDLVEVSLSQ